MKSVQFVDMLKEQLLEEINVHIQSGEKLNKAIYLYKRNMQPNGLRNKCDTIYLLRG